MKNLKSVELLGLFIFDIEILLLIWERKSHRRIMECVCQVDKGSIVLADDNIQPFLWNFF